MRRNTAASAPSERASIHATHEETAIGTFTSKQRAHLRALAHELKPTIHIGKEGVTVAAIRTVRQAFNTRELLKVRVLEAAPVTAREAGEALVESVEDAVVVTTVGRVVVLYRRHPEAPKVLEGKAGKG